MDFGSVFQKLLGKPAFLTAKHSLLQCLGSSLSHASDFSFLVMCILRGSKYSSSHQILDGQPVPNCRLAQPLLLQTFGGWTSVDGWSFSAFQKIYISKSYYKPVIELGQWIQLSYFLGYCSVHYCMLHLSVRWLFEVKNSGKYYLSFFFLAQKHRYIFPVVTALSDCVWPINL